jgi:hypothetical protein
VADFKELIATITTAVDKFNSQIPAIQQKMLQDVLALTRELDVKDGKIKIAASNMRVLAKLRMQLQKVLLNATYTKGMKEYVRSFDKVTQLQNEYFLSVEKNFRAPKLAKEIKNQAIEGVVTSLTETGLNANIVDKVHNLMRQASTSGGSISTLSKQLTDFIVNNETGEGQLQKYTKQITTDALNQYSGQYTQIISSDLGYEWHRYSGSNLETSRPFCLACTDRKFFHVCELPKVLRGEFPEFDKYDGKINKKSELPEGMIPGTDASNFMVNRGGYNCGHQWRPVSEDLVPPERLNAVHATPEYADWARVHGKKVPKPVPLPEKEKEPEVPPKLAVEDFVPAASNKGERLVPDPAGEPIRVVIVKKYGKQLESLKKDGHRVDLDLLTHLGEEISFVTTHLEKAFYMPDRTEITIGKFPDRIQSEYFRDTVFAHEVGHAIHNTNDIIAKNKVRQDFADHMITLKSLIAGKEMEIQRILEPLVRNNSGDIHEQALVMFDILGSLTRGRFGGGHTMQYYRLPTKPEAEIFAHSVTFLVRANKFEDATPELKKVVEAMKAYILNVL